jgi:hypothetical protein
MNKFRKRIIKRLAQSPKILGPTTAVPPALYSSLNSRFNSATVPSIVNLTKILNDALFSASNGSDSFQNLVNNKIPIATDLQNYKSIQTLSKRFYDTFLNQKLKPDAKTINVWADALTSSTEFNSLSKINQSGPLAFRH